MECASATSGSPWRLRQWDSSNDCSGAPDHTITAFGAVCTPWAGVSVDCGFAAACFGPEATAVRDPDGRVPFSSLRVGDRVLAVDSSGAPFFDRVFRIPHHDADEVTTYVRIRTDSGHALELAPGHMLHVGTCCALNDLTYAADVTVGDVVYVVRPGVPAATPVTVTDVDRVQRVGAFNVHLLHGTVVVNGIAATQFTAASAGTWSAASRPYAAWWYRIVDASAVVVGAQDESPRRHTADKSGLRV